MLGIWRLIRAEMWHRKLGSFMALLAVWIAATYATSSITFFKSFDIRTERMMATQEEELKALAEKNHKEAIKISLKMGFNVMILPKDQILSELYSGDYASKFMPESYVQKLANSKIVTVRHFLPMLEQRVKWPEKNNRTIFLIGLRDEVPPLHRDPKKPLVQPVPVGKIELGHEIALVEKLKVGDDVTLMGRAFNVIKIRPEQGDKGDISAWVHLSEAQEMFGKQGQINSIRALECKCAFGDITKVRKELEKYLPDTQVIEFRSKALRRAEMRAKDLKLKETLLNNKKIERQQLRVESERQTSLILPLVVVSMGLWVAMLFLSNARDRRKEIGILRALGWRSQQVVKVFLGKALLVGVLGAMLGYFMGFVGVGFLEERAPEFPVSYSELFNKSIMLWVLFATPALTLVSAWLPALSAAGQDPAEVLREE